MLHDRMLNDILSSAFAAVAPNPHSIPVALGFMSAWFNMYGKAWGTATAMARETTSALLPQKN